MATQRVMSPARLTVHCSRSSLRSAWSPQSPRRVASAPPCSLFLCSVFAPLGHRLCTLHTRSDLLHCGG